MSAQNLKAHVCNILSTIYPLHTPQDIHILFCQAFTRLRQEIACTTSTNTSPASTILWAESVQSLQKPEPPPWWQSATSRTSSTTFSPVIDEVLSVLPPPQPPPPKQLPEWAEVQPPQEKWCVWAPDIPHKLIKPAYQTLLSNLKTSLPIPLDNENHMLCAKSQPHSLLQLPLQLLGTPAWIEHDKAHLIREIQSNPFGHLSHTLHCNTTNMKMKVLHHVLHAMT